MNEEWEKLQEANKLIKTIKLDDKDYAVVPQRVKAFRFLYPKGQIDTITKSEERVVERLTKEGEIRHVRAYKCIALVYDDAHELLSTGVAEEIEGSSFINGTSFIENAETSAVGRALGFLGIIGDEQVSIATGEEVHNAKMNQVEEVQKTEIIQPEKKPTTKQLIDYSYGYEETERQKIRDFYGVQSDDELPRDIVKKALAIRKEVIKQKKVERDKAIEESGKDLNFKAEEKEFYE